MNRIRLKFVVYQEVTIMEAAAMVRSVLVLGLAAILAGCGGAAFTPSLDGQPVVTGDAGGVGAETAPSTEPGSEPQTQPTSPEASPDAGNGHDAEVANDGDAGPAPDAIKMHITEDSGTDSPASPAPDAGQDSGTAPDVVTGCTVGSMRCMGAQPLLCVAGAWEGAGPACTTTPCIAGACAACNPGATQCAGGTQPQTCGALGTWQNNGSPDVHSNGVGGTWQDCTSVGTIDEAEAMRACEAYTGNAGQCSASTSGCNWAIVQDNVNGYQWAYTGMYAGYVSTSGCSGFTGSTTRWN